MKSLRSILITITASAVIAMPLSAQSAETDRAGIPRVNLVSANPIGLLFEWYNGEFEHALKPTTSLGVTASSYNFDDARYTAIDGIVRYYPAARALRGFSIGGSVGFVDVNDDPCDGCQDESESSATIGVRGDYVWILGRDQRFAVAAGIGAKRLINDKSGIEGLPIGRLSIGYAW